MPISAGSWFFKAAILRPFPKQINREDGPKIQEGSFITIRASTLQSIEPPRRSEPKNSKPPLLSRFCTNHLSHSGFLWKMFRILALAMLLVLAASSSFDEESETAKSSIDETPQIKTHFLAAEKGECKRDGACWIFKHNCCGGCINVFLSGGTCGDPDRP